jgi:hypothetical protein
VNKNDNRPMLFIYTIRHYLSQDNKDLKKLFRLWKSNIPFIWKGLHHNNLKTVANCKTAQN